MQPVEAEENVIIKVSESELNSDLMEGYAICEVCGKPCGKIVPKPGKVYHWECAYENCREIREIVQKAKGI